MTSEAAAAVGIRVVTVSATYGAGGSLVAPRLAQRLGLPFADRLIPAMDATVAEPGRERVTEEERRQTSTGRFLARLAYVTGGLGMPVPTAQDMADPIRRRVEESIAALVDGGGAVILGRAGAVVLADQPRAFHVRLDGPYRRRVARAMSIEGTDGDTARARLEETDRARTRYVERLYGRNPSDPALYHLLMDTTVLATEDCVDLIARAAVAFWRHADDPSSGSATAAGAATGPAA
jgi:cytidylate kinase